MNIVLTIPCLLANCFQKQCEKTSINFTVTSYYLLLSIRISLIAMNDLNISYSQGPVHYQFDYAVSDPHTGDKKQHYEHRDGDVVKGSYSMKEADGTTRIVEYHATPKGGFNAVVKRIGTAVHPQVYKTDKHGEYGGAGHGHAYSRVGITHFGKGAGHK